MFRKNTIRFLIIALLSINIATVAVFADETTPSLSVNSKASILIEPSTGIILSKHNEREKLPPASVTKVMTILLIYDSIYDGKIKWDDVVTVSEHAASMGGSQIFLEPMEQQTVADLTKSIVIASANDAAVAMAEFIAGSEEGFVAMMNKRAKELGMEDTNFVNACGLDDPNHLTSALDIAIMSKELITKYPEVLEISKIWQDTIVHKTARGEQEFGLTNTNKIIRSYKGATGLKTGSTSEALYCLSATASRDGMDLIAVVLAAPDPTTRFHEVIKLFDYGFASYALSQGDKQGEVKGSIKIMKGEEETVPVAVKQNVTALVTKGKNKALEGKVELLSGLNAPVPKGTKAGEIIYYFDGKEVGRSDLVTVTDVKTASLPTIMQKLIKNWIDFK